jgi:hypothetical protein
MLFECKQFHGRVVLMQCPVCGPALLARLSKLQAAAVLNVRQQAKHRVYLIFEQATRYRACCLETPLAILLDT